MGLSAYSGHRTHIEFGPEGDADLEVLMVVEAAESPRSTPSASFPFQNETLDAAAKKLPGSDNSPPGELRRGTLGL